VTANDPVGESGVGELGVDLVERVRILASYVDPHTLDRLKASERR
jgi:hypothetical protein